MGRIKKSRILGSLFFIFVLTGLGLILYLPGRPQVESPVSQRPITQNTSPITHDPLSNMQNTGLPIFRDLFNPPIKPSPQEPAEEIFEVLSTPNIDQTEETRASLPPPPISSSLKLVGVIMGHPAIAILEESSSKVSHVVKEGDGINDEKVMTIKENLVIMQRDDQQLTLRLWEEE